MIQLLIKKLNNILYDCTGNTHRNLPGICPQETYSKGEPDTLSFMKFFFLYPAKKGKAKSILGKEQEEVGHLHNGHLHCRKPQSLSDADLADKSGKSTGHREPWEQRCRTGYK